jgi:large subunit ribosomal protein L24
MKPTKMRNKQIYYATMKTASAQLSSLLSESLRKKYGKKSVRVVEGDSVKVIRGEFTGVDGKVTKVSSANSGLTIEGVKKEKLKGEKYDVFINTSNIEVTALNTDDKWRINKLEGKNVRSARPENVKTVSKPKKENTSIKKEGNESVSPNEKSKIVKKEVGEK